MKKLVLFYSWSGKTAKLARDIASRESADLAEIADEKRPGTLAAYVLGCFRAVGMKRTPIRPISAKLDTYDKITVMSPTWAGHPVPAVNSALELLPAGKEIEFVMVSMSGSSSAKDKVAAVISGKGCRLAEYRDVKNS